MATTTHDLRGDTAFNRGVNASIVSQSPGTFDILKNVTSGEDDTFLGYWAEIEVINPDFPDNETSVFLETGEVRVGVNLSHYNGNVTGPHRIPGHFSEIRIASGSLMTITAFRF